MSVMTAKAFVDKAVGIAENYKTTYMLGPWGWPTTQAMIDRACISEANGAKNKTWLSYANAIKDKGFIFDCVGLIKGILWGWSGDLSKNYGGAGYAVNGVPDIGADAMISKCSGVSTDFSNIVPGEAVWMSGHIGIYVGGVVVESTPRWKWGVQKSTILNVVKSQVSGTVGTRTWTKHGKLPWVDYTGAVAGGSSGAVSQPTPPAVSGQEPVVGDVVTFTGTKHYTNANAATGVTCKPGEAKVTQISKGGKHPYHLIKTTGSSSTVYGWVDAADITGAASAAIVKGSTVKVNAGAKTYTGGGLASFVYQNTYTVIQVDGDRVVIGKGTAVTAAVNIKDLTLVG